MIANSGSWTDSPVQTIVVALISRVAYPIKMTSYLFEGFVRPSGVPVWFDHGSVNQIVGKIADISA